MNREGERSRPLLEMALTRIEEGTSRGLVVAKVDRFGRVALDGSACDQAHRRRKWLFLLRASTGSTWTTDTGRLGAAIIMFWSMAEG